MRAARLVRVRHNRARGKPGPGSSWDTFSLLLSTPHTLSSQPLSSLRALVRVAAGLPGGFSRARIGPFGLRGDARGRCRSRRERIAKPATPRPVLRPLGIAQGQRCRTRRHLPGLHAATPLHVGVMGRKRAGAETPDRDWNSLEAKTRSQSWQRQIRRLRVPVCVRLSCTDNARTAEIPETCVG